MNSWINRSGSILTRGKSSTIFRGITPFSSGFIISIEEIETQEIQLGGRGTTSRKEKNQKKQKIIRICVYINKEEYCVEKTVDEDITITTNDVLIEWNDQKPKISLKGNILYENYNISVKRIN